MTLVIGIDPGRKGAAVPLVGGAPVLVAGHPMAVRWDDAAATGSARAARIAALPRLAGCSTPAIVVVERIAINYNGPNRSGHAAVVEDAGWCVGVCDALGWTVEQRLAGSWLGDVSEPPEGDDRDTKVRALSSARAWWPGVDWRATPRAQKPHDGVVDAALLALTGHLAALRPGPWVVERDGGRGEWREAYRGPSEFRARWEMARLGDTMKRGAVRLVREHDGLRVVCEEVTT